jgi:hypothetical protein
MSKIIFLLRFIYFFYYEKAIEYELFITKTKIDCKSSIPYDFQALIYWKDFMNKMHSFLKVQLNFYN